MPKIQIDIFNGCNLRCPLCETGALKHPRGVDKIGSDDFQRILGSLNGFDEIHLFNKGESTLHPEICDFISMGKDHGFTMGLHSNLCIPQTRLNEIISAGLDRLTASIDGTSQSRYAAYRQKGNFDQAFANLTFAADKYHTGALSFLEWQFIVNRFNEDEVESFILIAAQMGINFLLVPIGIGQDVPDHFEIFDSHDYDWLPMDNRFQSSIFGGPVDEFGGQDVGEVCPHLMDGPVINPDLSVSVCCMTISDRGLVSGPRKQWSETIVHASEGRDYIEVCTECPRYLRHVGDPSVIGQASPLIAASTDESVAEVFDAEQLSYLSRNFPLQLNAFKAGLTHGLANDDISDQHPTRFFDNCIRVAVRGYDNPNQIQTPFSVLLLGTTASDGVSANRDLEFFIMAPAPNLTEQQSFYPFLCGVIHSAYGNIDSWCLMNMLTGHGVQKLASMAPWRYGDTLYNHLLLHRRSGGASFDHVFCDLTAIHAWGNLNVAKKVREQRGAHLINNRKKIVSFLDQQIRLDANNGVEQYGWVEDLRTLFLEEDAVILASLNNALTQGASAFQCRTG